MPDEISKLSNSDNEPTYKVITMMEDLAEIRKKQQSSISPGPSVASREEIPVSKVAAPLNLPISEKVEIPQPQATSLPQESKIDRTVISEIIQEIEPQQIKADELLKRAKFRRLIRILLITLIIAALFITAGYFVYSKFFSKKSEPTPIVSKTPPPITPTKSILNLDSKENINLVNNTTEELDNILSALVKEEFLGMKEIIIKSQLPDSNKKIDLINIFEILNIAYPRELFYIFNSNYYELFIYNAGGDEGGNLGFVIEIEPNDVLPIRELMGNWENSMIESFKPFYFGRYRSPDSFNFKDATYKGVDIRYINLNTPKLSIDYALLSLDDKSYVLFATSKEGMFEVIDKILTNSNLSKPNFEESETNPQEFIESES